MPGGDGAGRHDLRVRFDYVRATPWVQQVTRTDGAQALLCLAGPDGLLVTGPLLGHVDSGSEQEDGTRDGDASRASQGRAPRLAGTFTLTIGQMLTWDLTWFPSHEPVPEPVDPGEALAAAVAFWRDWSAQLEVRTDHEPAVVRSLLVLRALTHREIGGIVAADQYQADVIGEVMIALATLRAAGVADDEYSWALQKNLLRHCETNFDRKDHGI